MTQKNKPGTLILFFSEVARISLFSLRFFREFFRPGFSFPEFFRQAYETGYRSLPLVSITGFIMGLVLTIQSKPVMSDFGAAALIPSMVSVSIIREIGPVITALICAGKVGSSIGAELASMKVTEQIDAMEVSGTQPFRYLVITRILATTVMVPLLVIFSDFVALTGSFLGMNLTEPVTIQLFFNQALEVLTFGDIFPATLKTFFFGFAIGVIGCYKGYQAENGTEGVGMAANSAVVISSLLIFIIDMIAVQITDLLYA